MPVDSRVLGVTFPPGEADCWVGLSLQGDTWAWYYLTPQTEVTVDGERTTLANLALYLAAHRVTVRLASSPDGPITHPYRAEFHTILGG